MADMFNQTGYQTQPNMPVQTTQTQPFIQPQQQIIPQTYQNEAMNPYGRFQQWGNYQNTVQAQPSQQIQYTQQPQQTQDTTEYILLDGSAPNKKRKYVFVGEVDMQTNVVQPLPSFTLEDIRGVVAREFDVRFGEEKKK